MADILLRSKRHRVSTAGWRGRWVVVAALHLCWLYWGMESSFPFMDWTCLTVYRGDWEDPLTEWLCIRHRPLMERSWSDSPDFWENILVLFCAGKIFFCFLKLFQTGCCSAYGAFLYKVTRIQFPRGYSGRVVKLTKHIYNNSAKRCTQLYWN
jgi:hypothetical protein